jgi:hypothetical protein
MTATCQARSPKESDHVRYRGAVTTPTPATPTGSRRRAVTAPQARLLDIGLWLLVCLPPVASPFIDRRDLRAVDAVAAVIALVLLLARRNRPLTVLAVGLLAAIAATAVTGRPTALLPAIVVLLYNAAVSTDRQTSIRAGIAGLVSLVACVVIIASNEFLGPNCSPASRGLRSPSLPAMQSAAGARRSQPPRTERPAPRQPVNKKRDDESPRSGCTSRVSSTTWSPIRSLSSTSRRASLRIC